MRSPRTPSPRSRWNRKWLLGVAAVLAGAGFLTRMAEAVPLPKPRPEVESLRSEAQPRAPKAASAAPTASPRFATAATDYTSGVDIGQLKEAITAARKSNIAQASDLQKTITNPLARKLVEWAILRSEESENIELSRYTAFLAENASWPSIGLLRRRAEASLWADRPDAAFVRGFFAKHEGNVGGPA